MLEPASWFGSNEGLVIEFNLQLDLKLPGERLNLLYDASLETSLEGMSQSTS